MHYVTYKEVAEQLRVSVSLIKKFVANDGFPAHKLGRRTLFIMDEVHAWVLNRPAKKVAS